MTGTGTDLEALGAAVEWPDADAAASARSAVDPATGRLGDLVEWLAGAQQAYPPRTPTRPRCLVLGEVSDAVATLAASLDVGVRAIDLGNHAGTEFAIEHGSELADEEIDSGTDLLVIAGPPAGTHAGPAAAVVVSLLAGAEPVALLPRGAAAVDTATWIAHAELLRDTRHAAADLRSQTNALLVRLGDATLAAATGLVLRAAARRTPIVLDGVTTVVAGVLANDVQSRTSRWLRVADTNPDPVHARAVTELDQRPLLDLGTATDDGTAGLLTIPLVRAAATAAIAQGRTG